MTFKKKLTTGALAATLGLSLVAGGTWAAFNDIEEVDGSVAAGTLDLTVDPGKNVFNISNLKPGDEMTRVFTLDNAGSLAIKEVLLSIDEVDFSNYIPQEPGDSGYEDNDVAFGSNSMEEYLDQFRITLLKKGTEGTVEEVIVSGDENVTLRDIYEGNLSSVSDTHVVGDRINLASTANNKWEGLPVDPNDYDEVKMTIEFVDEGTEAFGDLEAQNVYQGDSADITFTLEATQWNRQDVSDKEGYVESNEKAANGAYGN